MYRLINWIKEKWKKLIKKSAIPVKVERKTVEKKKRREPIKSLWPSLLAHIEQWEESARDGVVHWSVSTKKLGLSAREYVHRLYENVPIWGAYAASDYAEVRLSLLDSRKVDSSAYRPQHVCFAWYGENGPKREKHHDDNILSNGITLLMANKSTELHAGTFPMNPGVLYDVQMSHWERGEGHSAIFQQVIVDDDGVVHPTWFWHAESPKIWHKRPDSRHVSRPKNRIWLPVGGKDLWIPTVVAASFNFCQERDAHWNCVVKSKGVPPICFPVLNHDIARVFPSRQRDGEGRIVHWTRAHKRQTKAGEIVVRNHIRGNTGWEIDGRHVQIMMPGKHASMAGTIDSVVNDGAEKVDFIKDPITGMVYSAIGDSMMRKLISRSQVVIEEIEVAA